MSLAKFKDHLSGHKLHYNSENVFNAEIVVSVAMKNARQSIRQCLLSILNQQKVSDIAIFLLDDSSEDKWDEKIIDLLRSPQLVLYQCHEGKITRIRNLQLKLAKEIFPLCRWFGRLDADDQLAHRYSIFETLEPVLNKKTPFKWVLAGNTLKLDGKLLKRRNFPSESLLTRKGLLKVTFEMSHGIPEAELPSCNLWLHKELNVTYPSVLSGEDHWLVAFLLFYKSNIGLLRTTTTYACYNLEGIATTNARQSNSFLYSRQLLHNSVLNWLNTHNNNGKEFVLGWGKESIVYKKCDYIFKIFNEGILTEKQVDWLKVNLRSPYFPVPTWKKENHHWIAKYTFQEMKPLETLSQKAISRFIQYCLNHNIVCLDFADYNCGSVNGEVFYFDIGRDIQSFKITYFRDMCARIYVLFILKWTHYELKKNTKRFRDNEEALKNIPGFEEFYKKELTLWISSQQKNEHLPLLTNQVKRSDKVSLLIKSCAMDAPTFEIQIHHILEQLCETQRYFELILLIDSRRQNFLREHNSGNYDKVVKISQNLLREGKIDRLLIAPDSQDKQLVEKVYKHWFGVHSKQTHTFKGVPIFSQLWAFEQVHTRYVLQLDCDVMICRRNQKHDYLHDMLTVIQEESVLSVGFNIPHSIDSKFIDYHSPYGGFTPEVRFGLLDLERIKSKRPFPNTTHEGFLTKTWYRSIEQFQKQNGLKSLRGGSSESYYIHPPNLYKNDIFYYLRLMDLVEQDQLPEIQYGKWDIIGSLNDWKYPSRNEELIVLIMGRNTNRYQQERCLNSLFAQRFNGWGAIIVDDASAQKSQIHLINLISQYKKQVTLVNRKTRYGKAKNEWELLNEICINPESQIIILDMDDCFIHSRVLDRIYIEYKKGYEIILGGMFRSDKPIKRYKVRFDDVNKPDAGNIWIHLRSFRFCLFSRLTTENLKIDGKWAAFCDDFAMMIPMVKQASQHIMIEEYLYLHERSTPNTKTTRHIKDKEIFHFTKSKSRAFKKRATRYFPNLKKIEIDITYVCNLRCSGCDRSCTQAPANLNMPIQMIEEFIFQTEEKGIQWESVHVLGGEPTLHPNFFEIIRFLDKWFTKNSPTTELKVISNGYSQNSRDILSLIPENWHHFKSFKNSNNPLYFEPFNTAPIDLPVWKKEDFSKGCWISQFCGIGLTPQGYFPCAVSGGIERIFRLGKGLTNLPQSGEIFKSMFPFYCRFCGHFFQDQYYPRTERKIIGVDIANISHSWKEAYSFWREKGPIVS
ncbi:MAG: glycosyltransferase [Fibrobacteria bacterium]|nr:glycosyltransferase [Fibrobacteria bacterium]